MAENSKKTTRRATSAIWRIFAELDKPKRKIKLYVFKPGIILRIKINDKNFE